MKNTIFLAAGLTLLLCFATCTGSRQKIDPTKEASAWGENIAPPEDSLLDSAVCKIYTREIARKIADIDSMEAFHVNPFRKPKQDEAVFGEFVLLNQFDLKILPTKRFTGGMLSETLCAQQNDTIAKLCLFMPEFIVTARNGLVFEISPACRQIRLKEVLADTVHLTRSIDYEDALAQVIDSIFVQP